MRKSLDEANFSDRVFPMNLKEITAKENAAFSKAKALQKKKEYAMHCLADKLAVNVLIGVTKALGLEEGKEITEEEQNDFNILTAHVAHLLQSSSFSVPVWPAKKEKKAQENEVKVAEVP